MNNPYAAPKATVTDPELPAERGVRYAGFWIRFVASVIDSILIGIVVLPLLTWIYGKDYLLTQFGLKESEQFFAGPSEVLLNYVFPAVVIILFWIARQATPGKMALSLKIVDAKTFGPLSKGQAIGRYFGYYVSTIPLLLGLFWVAFDARKRGWHDMLAGTVVIRT